MKFFRTLTFLYLFTFFTNLTVGMLGIALPLFAISLGAGNITLGAIGTSASIVYVSAVLFTARLSDRIPKNLQSGAGAILFGITLCMFPFVPKLAWVFPLVFCYIIGLALIWPSLESALARFVTGKQLAMSSGWYNVSWSSGATIGYLLGGYVYAHGAGLVFRIAGGAAILLGAAFISLFRAPAEAKEPDKGFEPGPVYLLYLSWLANGMIYFILNIMRNIFPRLAAQLHFSSANLGYLLLSLSLAQCALFIILNLTAKWHFKFWPLIVALFTVIAGLMVVTFTNQFAGFAIGFLLIGAGAGMTYSASLYYAVGMESGVAGERSGWHEFYVGVGGFSGPLVGGLLAHFVGPKSPYAASAGLVLVVIAIQVYLYSKKIKNGQKPVQ